MRQVWKAVALGDLCEVGGGDAAPQNEECFVGGTIPFVRMKDLGRYHFTNNLGKTDDKLTPEAIARNRMKLFDPGCILFPRSGSVALNHRAILGVRACIVSHIGILRSFSPTIAASYLYRFLQTFDMTSLSKKTTGVDSIAFSDVKRIKVPVPPPPEQERIVRILDAAEELRRLRAQADRRTADLIPALFDEMFSESQGTAGGWPRLKVNDTINLVNGRAFGPPDWGPQGLPIIRIQNLKDSKAPFNYFSGDLDPKFLVNPGAILISWAGQLVSFGVYIWAGPQAALNQHIFRVDRKEELASDFLWCALSQVVERAKMRFQGSEMKHLTKATLEEAELICPPLPLQKKFSARVAEIRALEARQAESRRRLDDLFQSLLHRAFRGEL